MNTSQKKKSELSETKPCSVLAIFRLIKLLCPDVRSDYYRQGSHIIWNKSSSNGCIKIQQIS